jgi:hypothetical protein
VCAKLGEGLRRQPNLFKEIGQPRAPSRLRQSGVISAPNQASTGVIENHSFQ